MKHKILIGFISLLLILGAIVFFYTYFKKNLVTPKNEIKIEVHRNELLSEFSHADKLFNQIRAVPYSKDNQIIGFKILTVDPKSIFKRLDLKPGMILYSFNNQKLTMDELTKIVINISKIVSSTNNIILKGEYLGKPITIHYEIEE